MADYRVTLERMEAWMAERRFGASVRDRIRRCNPGGYPEFEVPRGLAGRYHQPTIRSQKFIADICTRKQFERRWGPDTYRHLDPHRDLTPMGGKRRAVTRRAYEWGPSKCPVILSAFRD